MDFRITRINIYSKISIPKNYFLPYCIMSSVLMRLSQHYWWILYCVRNLMFWILNPVYQHPLIFLILLYPLFVLSGISHTYFSQEVFLNWYRTFNSEFFSCLQEAASSQQLLAWVQITGTNRTGAFYGNNFWSSIRGQTAPTYE